MVWGILDLWDCSGGIKREVIIIMVGLGIGFGNSLGIKTDPIKVACGVLNWE